MLRRTARNFLRLAKEEADAGKAKAKTAAKGGEEKKRSPTEKKIKPKRVRIPGDKKLRGWNIFEVIEQIPKPNNYNPKDKSTFLHKNGHGLNFGRKLWFRYGEPCYYTVTKFKPSLNGHKPKVWGVKTWRGKLVSEKHEQIPSCYKREWHLISNPSPALPFSIPKLVPTHAFPSSSSSSSTSTPSSPLSSTPATSPSTPPSPL